jgi:hypothetical protein
VKLRDLRGLVESAGGTLGEVVGPFPDGSGVATGSFSLPDGHWYTAEGRNVPPMPLRCGEGEGVLRRELEEACRAAARYALRASTMNGWEESFDPDAVVQNFVVGMLGYHTGDGLSSEASQNPSPVPEGFSSRGTRA